MNKLVSLLVAASTAFALASCQGVDPDTSKMKVINGYKQDPEVIRESGLKFLLGLKFGYSADPGHDKFCSGFRYGVQSIVTSAHCITNQVPQYEEKPVYVEFVTGTGEYRQKAGPIEIKIHPNYSPGCLEQGYQCADIAVIKLPANVYNSADFIENTEPAEIDFVQAGFPNDQPPILAGFGCSTDDFLVSGRCGSPTFKDLTYTIATDLEPRIRSKLELAEYFFQFEGLNKYGEGFGVGSGDSGGPVFRELAIPKKIREGDVKSFVIDGIAEFTEVKESGFGSTMGYDNVVLDLGSPVVADWLKVVLSETGSGTPKSVPPLSSDDFYVCQPFDVILDPAPDPVNIPEWTASRLGGVPQLIVDNLKQVKNGRTRIALGQCVRFVENSLTKLEEKPEQFANFDEMEATFLSARFTYLQILELILEMQVHQDEELLAISKLHIVQLQGQLELADAFISTTPGLSLGYDIVILFSGRNLLGEVDSTEYGLTAAGILVPGIFKGIAKSSSYLKKSVAISKKTGKYLFKSQKANQRLAKVVTAIEGVEDQYVRFIEQARKYGAESSASVRQIFQLQKAFAKICAL
ncbi:MAG: trypsin-like serine protease [Proteobacteria bacterium]|nr:MAG: trypsin-like serine protease [Pseudomonadota bacterium]